ncbi:MAG: MlaD family protein [Alphaproteobacteria bacterium]|nr:MlaD family protein [Alphaproteobacteria bacterium]
MKTPNKRIIGGFLIFGVLLILGSLLFFFGNRLERNYVTPVLFFEGSVKGLNIGAGVYFRGVPVGRVEKIQLISNNQDKIIIPVHVRIDPQMSKHGKMSYSEMQEWIRDLVKHGLKGKLQTQSVLTGQMTIELDFFPQYPERLLAEKYGISDLEIPTVPSILDEISQNLEKIPFSDISTNANGLLKHLNEDVPALLRQSTAAVASINKLANSISGPGASIISDFNKMVRDVSNAAKSVSRLSDYLERHPEALLKGKGGY